MCYAVLMMGLWSLVSVLVLQVGHLQDPGGGGGGGGGGESAGWGRTMSQPGLSQVLLCAFDAEASGGALISVASKRTVPGTLERQRHMRQARTRGLNARLGTSPGSKQP